MLEQIDIDPITQLRPIEPSDAEPMFQLIDRNRSYLREWLPWLDFNRSPEDSASFISRSIDQARQGTGAVAAIYYADNIAGVIGYNSVDSINRICEIGYWLDQDLQGNGIILRNTHELIDFAFSSLNINRICIPVATKNVRSRAMPEKLGFVEEGILREAEWLYDHFVDHVLYSKLCIDRVGERAE